MTKFRQKVIRTDADWLAAGNRERRGRERRESGDRRDMIRFDLDNGERRGSPDRRNDANSWQNGRTI